MGFQNLENFSFSFLLANFVLLFGILVAKIFERISLRFLEKIKLDQILKRIGWKEATESIGAEISLQNFISQLVKWFFIFLFLMAFFEILQLEKVSEFFETIVRYYPNIFISVVIFLTVVYLVDFSRKIFVASFDKEKIVYSPLVGKGLSFFIWILTILAILYQLKIVPELILVTFVGLVGMISLAVGISFGLGGKDFASKFLRELQEKLKK